MNKRAILAFPLFCHLIANGQSVKKMPRKVPGTEKPTCSPTPEKYEEALAKLGTSLLGKGRLWITDAKISHSGDTPDEKLGKIEWMTFSVEITLPRQ
ncbi:MAG: hypothetical protein ABSB88_09425 [Bryobacteraceae bacterium]|jgi:hypothetical protein